MHTEQIVVRKGGSIVEHSHATLFDECGPGSRLIAAGSEQWILSLEKVGPALGNNSSAYQAKHGVDIRVIDRDYLLYFA